MQALLHVSCLLLTLLAPMIAATSSAQALQSSAAANPRGTGGVSASTDGHQKLRAAIIMSKGPQQAKQAMSGSEGISGESLGVSSSAMRQQPFSATLAGASNPNNPAQRQGLQRSLQPPKQVTGGSVQAGLFGKTAAITSMQKSKQPQDSAPEQRANMKVSFQKLSSGNDAQQASVEPNPALDHSQFSKIGHGSPFERVADLTQSTWEDGARVIPSILDKQPALPAANDKAQQPLGAHTAKASVDGDVLFGNVPSSLFKDGRTPPSSKHLDWGRPEGGPLIQQNVVGSLSEASESSAHGASALEAAAVSGPRAQRPFEQVADLTSSSWQNGHRVIPGIAKLPHEPAVVRPLPSRTSAEKDRKHLMPAAAAWGGISDTSPRMISLQDLYTGSPTNATNASAEMSRAAIPPPPGQRSLKGRKEVEFHALNISNTPGVSAVPTLAEKSFNLSLHEASSSSAVTHAGSPAGGQSMNESSPEEKPQLPGRLMLAGGDDLLSSAASAAGSRARGYPSPPTPPAAAQFGAASGHSPPASATAAAFPGLVNPSTSPSALSGSAALLKMLAPFFNPPYAQRIPAAPGTAAGEPQPQAQAPPVTSSAQFVIPASPVRMPTSPPSSAKASSPAAAPPAPMDDGVRAGPGSALRDAPATAPGPSKSVNGHGALASVSAPHASPAVVPTPAPSTAHIPAIAAAQAPELLAAVLAVGPAPTPALHPLQTSHHTAAAPTPAPAHLPAVAAMQAPPAAAPTAAPTPAAAAARAPEPVKLLQSTAEVSPAPSTAPAAASPAAAAPAAVPVEMPPAAAMSAPHAAPINSISSVIRMAGSRVDGSTQDALAGALTQYFGASGSPVPSVSTQSALPGRHLRKLLDVQALDTGITLQSNVSSPEDLSEQLAGAVGSGHLEQSLRERGQNISSLQLISIDGLPYIQVPPPDSAIHELPVPAPAPVRLQPPFPAPAQAPQALNTPPLSGPAPAPLGAFASAPAATPDAPGPTPFDRVVQQALPNSAPAPPPFANTPPQAPLVSKPRPADPGSAGPVASPSASSMAPAGQVNEGVNPGAPASAPGPSSSGLPEAHKQGSNHTGAIVGGIVGGIVAASLMGLLLCCWLRRSCRSSRGPSQGFFTPCAHDSSSADTSSSGNQQSRPAHTKTTLAKWVWPAAAPAAASLAPLPSTAVPAPAAEVTYRNPLAPTLRPIRTSLPPKTGDLHNVPQRPTKLLGPTGVKGSSSAASESGFWWWNGAFRPPGHASASDGKRMKIVQSSGDPAVNPHAAAVLDGHRLPTASGGWLRRLTRPRGDCGQERGKCACQVMMESGDQYPTGWFTNIYRGRLESNGKCKMCQAQRNACNHWLRDVEAAHRADPEDSSDVS
ncbi:hypothetical protein WJX74_010288 [Apatococcus lobatus]|uniref:Uncharacterized protein n=1 Tax=Apatococcus lobatus TaxID=904363 RepID=A0AAW1RZF5_9CHLO